MKDNSIHKNLLEKGFSNLCTAKAMTEEYEVNFKEVSKYVHATSRGHEAIQTAVGMQLLPQDYAFPYYRDDAMLLAFGMTPYELMLQLLAKKVLLNAKTGLLNAKTGLLNVKRGLINAKTVLLNAGDICKHSYFVNSGIFNN